MYQYTYLAFVYFNREKHLLQLCSQRSLSCWSKIKTSESVPKQSKSCEALLSFTLNWQWWEDKVKRFWTEDGWRFNYYLEYISLLKNKRFNRARCEYCKIDRRYSKDVEASYSMMKCIVQFKLRIIYVMFHFFYVCHNNYWC